MSQSTTQRDEEGCAVRRIAAARGCGVCCINVMRVAYPGDSRNSASWHNIVHSSGALIVLIVSETSCTAERGEPSEW